MRGCEPMHCTHTQLFTHTVEVVLRPSILHNTHVTDCAHSPGSESCFKITSFPLLFPCHCFHDWKTKTNKLHKILQFQPHPTWSNTSMALLHCSHRDLSVPTQSKISENHFQWGDTHATVQTWRPEGNFQESVFSLGSCNLHNKRFHPWSQLMANNPNCHLLQRYVLWLLCSHSLTPHEFSQRKPWFSTHYYSPKFTFLEKVLGCLKQVWLTTLCLLQRGCALPTRVSLRAHVTPTPIKPLLPSILLPREVFHQVGQPVMTSSIGLSHHLTLSVPRAHLDYWLSLIAHHN